MFLLGCTQPATAQWTFGAYVGWAAPFRVDVYIDDPATAAGIDLDGLRFETRSFDTPLYYGLRGGFLFSGRVGAEVEFIHLKVFAELDEAARRLVERLNVSHGLNLVLGNFLVRVPLDRAAAAPRFALTARAGAGATVSHTEAALLGMSADRYESGGPAAQAAGGIEMRVRRNVYAFGEYKFTYSQQNLSVGTASVEFPVRTHHIVGGIGYRF